MWQASNGKPIYQVHAHDKAATCVAISPDGQRIASAGADRRLRVWAANLEQETLHSLRTTQAVVQCSGGDAEACRRNRSKLSRLLPAVSN